MDIQEAIQSATAGEFCESRCECGAYRHPCTHDVQSAVTQVRASTHPKEAVSASGPGQGACPGFCVGCGAAVRHDQRHRPPAVLYGM